VPSTKKLAYLFLSRIVRSIAMTSNGSVPDVLAELQTMLESDGMNLEQIKK